MEKPHVPAILSTDTPTSIRLARFTSASKLLTKTVSLGADGQLVKETSAPMSSGAVENLTIHTLDEFVQVLTGLKHNQALAYGVSLRGDGPIMSEKRWETDGRPEGVLQRNRAHFDWPNGGGIWMLDYDPPKTGGCSDPR